MLYLVSNLLFYHTFIIFYYQ